MVRSTGGTDTLKGHSFVPRAEDKGVLGKISPSQGLDSSHSLKEGKHLSTLDGGDILSARCFSPNCYWLCCHRPSIQIWDLEGKVIVGELKQEVISTSGKAQSPQWLCMLMAKLCWLRQTIWNKYGRWPLTSTTKSFKNNKTCFLIKKKSNLWIRSMNPTESQWLLYRSQSLLTTILESLMSLEPHSGNHCCRTLHKPPCKWEVLFTQAENC